jgi:hypothetical protein
MKKKSGDSCKVRAKNLFLHQQNKINMCNCEKCQNKTVQKYTQVLHDCSTAYNGVTPFSIVAVTDTTGVLITPSEAESSGRGSLNSLGYLQNFFCREFIDLELLYISKVETLPILADTKVILIVYNNTN